VYSAMLFANWNDQSTLSPIPRYTIFLKDGHPAVTKGMESSWRQTELIRRYDGELCASGASGQSPDF
jgi:hypothetical protein